MRLVTLGMVAVLLSAGCAVQTGDPTGEGDPSGQPPPTEVQSGMVPATVSTSGPPGTQQSTVPVPTRPVQEDSTGGSKSNPEPSPWHGETAVNPPATGNNAGGTGSGTSNPAVIPVDEHGFPRRLDDR